MLPVCEIFFWHEDDLIYLLHGAGVLILSTHDTSTDTDTAHYQVCLTQPRETAVRTTVQLLVGERHDTQGQGAVDIV